MLEEDSHGLQGEARLINHQAPTNHHGPTVREPTQLSWEKHPKTEVLQRALQVSQGPPGEEKWKGDWGRENSRFKAQGRECAWQVQPPRGRATTRKQRAQGKEGGACLLSHGEAGEDLCRKAT